MLAMKKQLLSLLLLSCLYQDIHGQACLPEGILFTTQAEIDNFPVNYPGCTVIEGSVRISGADITNLNGLNAVTAIGDSLFIYQCENLTTPAGLSNLTTIGGIFYVSGTKLVIMDGLEKLTTIGADLIFSGNGYLQSLDGLQNLSSLGGEIRIQNNQVFVSLSALSNLPDTLHSVYIENNGFYNLSGLFDGVKVVNGDLLIGGAGINLEPLKSLKTVTGGLNVMPWYPANFAWLKGLESLGGLSINCQNLDTLDGLPLLTRIDGQMDIFNGNRLTNLSGFNQLEYVGRLNIVNNPALVWVTGLNGIDTLGHLSLSGNPALQELGGFNQLEVILEDLWLWNNDQLATFGAFDKLRFVGNEININGSWQAPDMSGFQKLEHVGGIMYIASAYNLANLQGLGKLRHIGGIGIIWCDNLTSLHGLDSLTEIGIFGINSCHKITNFEGLEQVKSMHRALLAVNCPGLLNMNGLGGLDTLGDLYIENCVKLETLTGLGPVKSLDTVAIIWNGATTPLHNLRGLDSVRTITGDLILQYLPQLDSLSGLEQLTKIEGSIVLESPVRSLTHLGKLKTVGGTLKLHGTGIVNFDGLNALESAQDLVLSDNYYLTDLVGLDNLKTLNGDLRIANHASLINLNGLSNLAAVGGNINIFYNAVLSDCAIEAICSRLNTGAGAPPDVHDNAFGCESPGAISLQCGGKPLRTRVLLDNNNNCIADDGDMPAVDMQVLLTDAIQMTLRPTNTQGLALFHYKNTDQIQISLPQFPAGNWDVCTEPIVLETDTLSETSLPTLLLKPRSTCPELTLDLAMPAVFRGCFVSSHIGVQLNNTGAVSAKDFSVAVVLPPVLDWVNAWPWPSLQNGDTLFFDFTGVEMPPFAPAYLSLEVRTRCDTFLFGHTLCIEAFVIFQNPCTTTPVAFSEVKLSSQCMGDTTVRFTLKNIGDAPTQGQHRYTIYQNENPVSTNDFSLNAQQSTYVDVPADGSTWRMEATKLDNGTLTATALENCGGLTPGLITAFWLEEGPPGYDFDCRQVVLAYDPNEKSAIPPGIGPDHSIAADRSLVYTIDFQNTGTDTAYRVLLRDVLPPGLKISTFRPRTYSHPCVWEIRGGDTLEVLFYPIFLPDSNVNEPASRGYFSFEVDLEPWLPAGTKIENTASIVFDFNPPITTNTVLHTIGKLTLLAPDSGRIPTRWRVLGNPTRDTAIFQTTDDLPGEKRFDLFDALGQPVRTAQFSGQTFEFRRDGLPAGWYVFRITDAQGRAFSGKIAVVE